MGGYFDSKGDRIVVAWGKNARVWNIEAGQLLLELNNGHTADVRGCAFSPDNQMILTGSIDSSIVSWDVRCHRQKISFSEKFVTSVDKSDDLVYTSNAVINKIIQAFA